MNSMPIKYLVLSLVKIKDFQMEQHISASFDKNKDQRKLLGQ